MHWLANHRIMLLLFYGVMCECRVIEMIIISFFCKLKSSSTIRCHVTIYCAANDTWNVVSVRILYRICSQLDKMTELHTLQTGPTIIIALAVFAAFTQILNVILMSMWQRNGSVYGRDIWHLWQIFDNMTNTCINLLRPSDAIWRWETWSPLVPYHNPFWLIVDWVLWNKF